MPDPDTRISDEARKAVNDKLIDNDPAATQAMQAAAKSSQRRREESRKKRAEDETAAAGPEVKKGAHPGTRFRVAADADFEDRGQHLLSIRCRAALGRLPKPSSLAQVPNRSGDVLDMPCGACFLFAKSELRRSRGRASLASSACPYRSS